MSEIPSRRKVLGTALAGAAVATASQVGGPLMAQAQAQTPPTNTKRTSVRGTWVLQQVTSVRQLETFKPRILEALRQFETVGFSLRAPWDAVDRDLDLFDMGREIAVEAGKRYCIRFMAGQHTPHRVFDQGGYSFPTERGSRPVPAPFQRNGTAGNPQFEQAFEEMVRSCASWCRGHGVDLLHLPWYGYLWAEIYNDLRLQRVQGYSENAWIAAHKKLIDIAHDVAGNDLAVEFAFSGYWGGRNQLATVLQNHIVQQFGDWSDDIFVQGNGWGRYNGKATGRRPIWSAKQMYDIRPRPEQNIGRNWDWTEVYKVLYDNHEQYGEVYLDSFRNQNTEQLRGEIAKFAPHDHTGTPQTAPNPPDEVPSETPHNPPFEPVVATPTGLRAPKIYRHTFEVVWDRPSSGGWTSTTAPIDHWEVNVDGAPVHSTKQPRTWVNHLSSRTDHVVTVIATDAKNHRSNPATINVRTT